jgi:SAM-dependent methyltransferase
MPCEGSGVVGWVEWSETHRAGGGSVGLAPLDPPYSLWPPAHGISLGPALVTGIDFLEEPIRRAKLKAAERGLNVTFLVKDALTLKDWTERFDDVIDSGLFHVFSDEDRKPYAEGLATVLKPGGRLYLMCFSDEEPGTQGPRRVSKKELHAAFAQGWDIESIEPTRVETRPDLKEFTFSKGGPKAWFAVIRRTS